MLTSNRAVDYSLQVVHSFKGAVDSRGPTLSGPHARRLNSLIVAEEKGAPPLSMAPRIFHKWWITSSYGARESRDEQTSLIRQFLTRNSFIRQALIEAG